MLIKKPGDIKPSEITSKELYMNRRQFILAASATALSAGAVLSGLDASLSTQQVIAGEKLGDLRKSSFSTSEKLNSFKDITTYNNFYELGTDKSDPAENAKYLTTRPWTVAVEGEVKKPKSYDIDALTKVAPLEERIYRLRCVEAWSMVIPWVGFPLSALVKLAEPTGNAKYIQFITLQDPKRMPGQKFPVLEWPYVEGLRMDEAMHPLTILVRGALRRNVAGAKRSADPAGRTVEIRLQKHQIHRQDPLRRETTADCVESDAATRIRFLFQCKPGSGSPALEPGDGTAHR